MNGEPQPLVLITGASGLLGFSLIREFTPHCRLLTPELDEFDILNRDETLRYIGRHRPNLIIHAAAYTAVDKAEEEPEAAMALNREGTRTVALGAADSGACLIYISTDYVFSGRKQDPYHEDDPTGPLGSYGRSKAAGEEVLREVLDHFLIARTAWIFGPGRPNFVFGMARRAEKSEAVRVVDDQIGCPTYTPHLAAALRKLWNLRAQGIWHLVNDGSCSWYELTRKIYGLVGVPSTLVSPTSTAELGRPAPRPMHAVLSTDKYRRLTGAALPKWESALEEYFRVRDLWQPGGP